MLSTILNLGSDIESRNSTTKRYRNLSATFNSTPLISIRKTAWKSALREMEWFLSGSNNIKDLHPSIHSWWQPWVELDGSINNHYGVQLTDFVGRYGSINQVEYLIKNIKEDPYSRRHVITVWNSADMFHFSTKLTNCHNTCTQAFVEPDNTLHLHTYQRSADMLLGVPHNFIQMWAFLMYLSHHTGYKVGSLSWMGGDCHIYQSHIEAAKKIITNDPTSFLTPELIYTPTSNNFLANDFSLIGGYKPLISDRLEMIV